MDNFRKLPDDLLLRIISLLPLKDAVRTCIISSRWRYLYASMSNLVLDFEEKMETIPIGFMDIVERFFYYRDNRCPLDTFDLDWSVSEKLDPSISQRWIQAVKWHGIRNLVLTIPATVQLPSSLCTCKTLEVLLVHMISVSDFETEADPSLEVPNGICLPNLKVLELRNLIFSDGDSLNRLIANCPVLEELVCSLFIDDCKLNISSPTLKSVALHHICSKNWSGRFEISINAPNVDYLGYFVLGVTSQAFVNLKSLKSAAIEFPHKAGDLSHHVGAATDLMRVISNIQALRITGSTLIDIYKFNIPIPVFHYATHLTIFCSEFCLGALLNFLECCVSLEALVIEDDLTCNLDGGRNLLDESRVSCLLSRLKTIEITLHKGNVHQMELVKFFLTSAKCLKRMKIKIEDGRCEEKYDIAKRMLMFPRASRECLVHFDL